MTKDEALKLALEALELHGEQYPHMVKGYCLDAITAIKEALAQPEQEPVAWIETVRLEWLQKHGDKPDVCTLVTKYETGYDIPLYTTPPQRKPLTDEEALELWNKHEKHWRFENNALAFARAIEAAHGIKGEA